MSETPRSHGRSSRTRGDNRGAREEFHANDDGDGRSGGDGGEVEAHGNHGHKMADKLDEKTE